MSEGDSLRRIAARMQPLVGDTVAVSAEHARARALNIAEQLDGRLLRSVEARGKYLVLRFEPRRVLVSHLKMRGRWRVRPLVRPAPVESAAPWLRITGATHEATQWNGPVLELNERRLRRLGPDLLDRPLPLDELVASLRRADQARAIGDVLLDQQIVAGIGNMWRAEVLFSAGIPPGQAVGELSDPELRGLIELASESMSTDRSTPRVYRRSGRPCRDCGTPIASRRVGEHARLVYFCPSCQAGNTAREA